MIEALDIFVKGIVQGVGFRPFVYRLAKRYLINGWVLNARDGVHIRAEGESNLLDEFVLEISENPPSAAKISEIEIKEVPLEPYRTFEIRFSEDNDSEETTFVSPELATCKDCESELFDPGDRRYRYPFINCTNCGPRFTIIDRLPYDRPNTSMAEFPMCDVCKHEYDNANDRRFHAQPNACFDCGPKVYFATSEEGFEGAFWGSTREESDKVFKLAVDALIDGKILAVKGLGGFHLVCDANNTAAVSKLRTRKHREGKPFAVMMRTLEDVQKLCEVGREEAYLLEGSVRPIVLLRKKVGVEFTAGLCDKLPEVGVMLPYTPVQHILLYDFAKRFNLQAQIAFEHALEGAEGIPEMGAEGSSHLCMQECGQMMPPMLVMTSGNVHDDPIVIDDKEAFSELGDIADAFVGNNRKILTRFDDSVVRVIRAGTSGYAVQLIRRARGYAPTPIPMPERKEPPGMNSHAQPGSEGSDMPVRAQRTSLGKAAPCVFAAGPEQKNTFAFTRKKEVLVSQHIGDMENAEVFDAWLEAKAAFQRLFELHPDGFSCDMHPEYMTTKWVHEQSALHKPPLPIVEVQHHHAHIVSVIAENALDGPVCGIAMDGTGYGCDGNIWGGEVLISNMSDFERFVNFSYVPMPGGASAIKHPLQMAYGVLWAYDLLDHSGAKPAIEALGKDRANNLEAMIEQGVNTPVTSSAGRLFDAASALLGICTEPRYEGEPACLLEAALWDGIRNCERAVSKCGGCGSVDGGAGINVDAYAHGGAAVGATRESALAVSEDDLALSSNADDLAYRIDVVKNVATSASTAHDTSVFLFDAEPAFRSLLDDFAEGVPVPVISRRFHDAFVEAILQAAQLALALYDIRQVALSGGVFMNRYIMERSLQALEQGGFTVAINKDLPPNDGCASFGEAVVSLSRLQ